MIVGQDDVGAHAARGGGVGEVQQTDYSIGMLNVGGRLGEDLYLSINIPDYCGPSMGGDVSGDYYGFQGFPHCALNSQTIARFDGKENYVIDCDVVEWAGYTNDNGGIVSGHISGTLHILDGPHPTPPY